MERPDCDPSRHSRLGNCRCDGGGSVACRFPGPLQDTARHGHLITAVAETDPSGRWLCSRAYAVARSIPRRSDFQPLAGIGTRGSRGSRRAASNGIFREVALDLIAREWAATDGPRAVEWAAALSDSGRSRPSGQSFPFGADALTTALKVWMDQDAAAANDWLENLADGKKRVEAIGSARLLIADDDPRPAAQKCSEKMVPAGERRDGPYERLSPIAGARAIPLAPSPGRKRKPMRTPVSSSFGNRVWACKRGQSRPAKRTRRFAIDPNTQRRN